MRVFRLQDLLQIKNGKDHKGIPDGDVPIFGSGGLMRFGTEFLYDKESILLPRKGTLSNIQWVNEPFWTVDTIYYTVLNEELVDGYFLYSYLKTLDLSKLNTGTGVPSMTFGAYYDVEVMLPELKVQKKISNLLKSIKNKIELNNRINEELEAMAKTIYDYWFVQFDFPDKNGKPYKTSGGKMVWNEELKREIPDGWEVKDLKDCMRIVRGASPRPIDNFMAKSGTPWIKISDATSINHWFIVTTKEFIKEEGVRHSRELQPGTLILSNSASPGIPRIVEIRSCVHDGWLIIDSFQDGLYNEFMLFFFEHFRKKILNMGSGSIFKNLKTEYIKELKIALPPEELLLDSKEVFSKINAQILTNVEQIRQLTTARDWLLPMLMNGQVRVD